MNGYRWWTVSGGRTNCISEWWLKLGPVTLGGYIWCDGRRRVSLCLLNQREVVLFGGPL